jgi:hypothetical protein
VQNRKSLASNFYTFKISNRDSFEEWFFSPDNFSTSFYYNYFTLSVGTQSVATGPNVVLDLEAGEYHYAIYQTTGQYDLALSTSLGIIEVGILIVGGTSSTPNTFTQSDDDTIKVFTNI